jgi:hypothetical protein
MISAHIPVKLVSTKFQHPAALDAHATSLLEAGAADCLACRLSTPGVVHSESTLTVKADPMTKYVLDYMFMMTSEMINLGISIPESSTGEIDSFVSELLLRSYAATWSTFSFYLGYADPPEFLGLETSVEVATEGLIASVSRWRVALWLSLNALVTISGILFLVLQSRSSEPLISDPAIAAILLDSSEVLHAGERGLCNFSSLTKADDSIGKLRLRKENTGHRKLEVVY